MLSKIRGHLSPAEIQAKDENSTEELIKRLKKRGEYRGNPLRAEAFEADPEMQKFEDWQDRAGKMMYTEDKILLEKWQNDVK